MYSIVNVNVMVKSGQKIKLNRFQNSLETRLNKKKMGGRIPPHNMIDNLNQIRIKAARRNY